MNKKVGLRTYGFDIEAESFLIMLANIRDVDSFVVAADLILLFNSSSLSRIYFLLLKSDTSDSIDKID
jgi:hypothetical protein